MLFFYQVDNNVTRHLANELKPTANWDIMILHYLGLDHIGHMGGPRSPLMPNKLTEMDNIIKRIINYMVNFELHTCIKNILILFLLI